MGSFSDIKALRVKLMFAPLTFSSRQRSILDSWRVRGLTRRTERKITPVRSDDFCTSDLMEQCQKKKKNLYKRVQTHLSRSSFFPPNFPSKDSYDLGLEFDK